MHTIVVVLWLFLANGNVVTYRFGVPGVDNLGNCLSTQGIIQKDADIRGDRSISRMMCIPEDTRAFKEEAPK